jgi:hypothetical protein
VLPQGHAFPLPGDLVEVEQGQRQPLKCMHCQTAMNLDIGQVPFVEQQKHDAMLKLLSDLASFVKYQLKPFDVWRSNYPLESAARSTRVVRFHLSQRVERQ